MKTHAPAIEGRDNVALIVFIAEKLGLPRRAVEVLRGDTSRQKLFRIHCLTEAELKDRLK